MIKIGAIISFVAIFGLFGQFVSAQSYPYTFNNNNYAYNANVPAPVTFDYERGVWGATPGSSWPYSSDYSHNSWNTYNAYGNTVYGTYNTVTPATYVAGPVVNEYIHITDRNAIAGTSFCATAFTRTLSYGMRGDDVATLQDYLHDQGYLTATPNGYFGYGTQSAVKAFQRSYSISQTGTVGPQTRDALNSVVCGGGTTRAHTSPTTEITPTYVGSTGSMASYVAPVSPVSFVPTSVAPISSSVASPFVPSQGITPIIAVTGPQYPITDRPGPASSLTITSPLNRSGYREGDVMNISWVVSSLSASRFDIVLENTGTQLTKLVATLSGNERNTSITLSKSMLDAVCAGTSACSLNNSDLYRISVVAYGSNGTNVPQTIKAYAERISIIRPYAVPALSMSVSKSPINSGETINLMVAVPSIGSPYTNYTSLYWKVRAICPAGVSVTINGQACGTESYVYQPNITTPPEIKATIVNNSWGPQNITFEAIAYGTYGGAEIGRATASVIVNR